MAAKKYNDRKDKKGKKANMAAKKDRKDKKAKKDKKDKKEQKKEKKQNKGQNEVDQFFKDIAQNPDERKQYPAVPSFSGVSPR